MSPAPAAPDFLAAARELVPLVREHRDATERDRRLPEPLVGAVAATGIWRMLVPAAAGGFECDPAVAYDVIETISEADGAAGWNVMIGLGQGLFAAFFPPEVVREIWTASERSVTGGATTPTGHARRVQGGYEVSGRWPFGSGGQHCTWLKGLCLLDADGGETKPLLVNFPAERVTWLDTWDALGMRGSGSHDYTVENLFVPEAHATILGTPPLYDGPLYRVPFAAIAAGGVASCAVGVARGAMREFQALMTRKVDGELGTPVRERPHVIVKTAQAEALIRAGRAFVREALAEVWREVDEHDRASRDATVALVLAATHAAQTAAAAVELLFKAAGTTGVYAKSPLERAFRDVHTAAAHVTVQETNHEYAGRVLLGLEPGVPWL